MQRSSHSSATPLFDGCHALSSFPVGIRRAAIRSTVLMIAILLASCAIGGADRAHAQPALVVQSIDGSVADPYAGFIREAAQRFDIPAPWIGAVIAMESGGDARALSPRGAMGLMQIMPDTWSGLRARYGLGTDPYEPRDNILAGAAYLREMHDRYGSPGFLAAYNAGPARYDEYLATGRQLPAETQLYIAMLAPLVGQGQVNGGVTVNRRVVSWEESPLFPPDKGMAVDGLASVRPPSDRTSASVSVAGPSAMAPRSDGLFVRHVNAR